MRLNLPLSNTLILQMSHPVNDEILERLYEEALEYIAKKNKYQYDSNQKELEDAAALIAKQWFEERCQ